MQVPEKAKRKYPFTGASEAAQYFRAFAPFFWKNFTHDRIFLSAGSLAFQTFLSIVPILAVILSILNVFSVFAPLKSYINDFIVQNFMPGSGNVLNYYLTDFIGKTSSVPLFGGLFLVIIALFLISTIDQVINDIWEVHAPRKVLQGFTLYWTVLTLGPVLIASSLAASSYVWYLVFTEGSLLAFKTRLLSLVPFFNSILAFFLLYMLVPNCRVRFRDALSGAFVAAVLFELSKKWFAFYVTHLATFQHIYGALSLIPMFFFWIYLGWVVVLTGAEFVFCLGALKSVGKGGDNHDPLREVFVVLPVIASIWNAQQEGRVVTMRKLVKGPLKVNPALLRKIVDILLQERLVHVTANGELAVSRDLHNLTLYDFYRSIPPGFVSGDENRPMDSAGKNVHFETIRKRVSGCLESSMDIPLASLIEELN
ncbi:MAG: YihY family inner membrane protein [Chlorobiaceae bacterium]|nr:YihY family inner membrane protein [Chlorobiaceae bacterium]NTW09747.1 YihY family inner membrane protein [Chlorobiaceae bacterium]